MDSKAIGELMHQRRMEERERQQQNAAKLESSHDMSADALAHAMDSRLDIDHHSTKAENARLSLALATFGGVPSNMPAESLFNEKDSDDELDEETADEDDAATVDAVQKSDSKPGRKRREKDAGAATPSKRAVLDESVLSLEGDSDDEKDTTKKKDRINALLARAKVIQSAIEHEQFMSLMTYMYILKKTSEKRGKGIEGKNLPRAPAAARDREPSHGTITCMSL